MAAFDAVLVGSGINTMTAAALLARDGWSLCVLEREARRGGAIHTVFVDDLDARVAEIASRGLEPADRETYAGKARKAIYRDADGNEISFGGPDD